MSLPIHPSPEQLQSILFGGTLEHKLGTAHFDRVSVLTEHETPGRSGRLSLDSSSKVKSQFPKNSELKIASNRGRLLHYFANHELLAIETMAFVLLRFPDADPAFRAGVFRTLQDEQRHLSQYIKRMNDFGVELGDFPLNLYFWNTLRQMKSPMDFVTQMSLTFEQANLDFACFYANLFQTEIDDVETGVLLKEVHDDEIKHVAHGMKWFSEWRNADESEFESYQNLLPFPMTPRRARGSTFFAGASRASAGMSADFIESVRIAGGSRGKVPNYFFFNPQAEMEIALPELPRHLREKMDEMAPIMLWLAHEEDVVELPKQPDLPFLSQLYNFKGEIPEIVTSVPDATRYAAFDEFKPWGFGQSAWKKLAELNSPVRRPPSFPKTLHSEKLFSKRFWKETLKDSEKNLNEAALASCSELLIKVDRSTSGRGHTRIPKDHLHTPQIQSKFEKIRARGEDVIVEPLFDRVHDFSIQYEILENGKVLKFDPRFFVVDHLFQYQGSILGKPPSSFSESIRAIEAEWEVIQAEHARVISTLKEEGYVGPFGIDSFTFRLSTGELNVRPVVEVNARYTMGRVAYEIENLFLNQKQKQGVFKIFNSRDLRAQGANSFAELETKLRLEFGENFVSVTPSSAKETWVFAVFSQDAVSRFLFGTI